MAAATDKRIRTSLKNIDPDEVFDAPALEDEEVDGNADDPHSDPEPDIYQPLVILDRSYLEWKRCQVDCGNLRVVKVIFDHFSSADKQRGYANCLKHANCFRWRTCTDFSDRNALCSYLYAWAVCGEHMSDRNSHMNEFEPSDADIHEVSSTMTLTEF